MLVLCQSDEQECQPRGGLLEQGMCGVAGRQKVISMQPKETLPTTPRGPYFDTTPVKGQCTTAIYQCYVGAADYDAK